MMAVRTSAVLLLLMLVSPTDGAVAAVLVCYVLDGFLLIYCIVVTSLLFRHKLTAGRQEDSDSIKDTPQSNDADDNYEELPPPDPPSEPRPPAQRQEASEGTYQALRKKRFGDQSDAYQVLKPKKKKPKKQKKVFETPNQDAESGPAMELQERPSALPENPN